MEVTGGLITGGMAGNPGGGAFRVAGTFNMYGGTLIGNYTQFNTNKGSGGAIWTGGSTTIAGNSRIVYNKGTEGNRGGRIRYAPDVHHRRYDLPLLRARLRKGYPHEVRRGQRAV